jgi:dienelactone hydrolase
MSFKRLISRNLMAVSQPHLEPTPKNVWLEKGFRLGRKRSTVPDGKEHRAVQSRRRKGVEGASTPSPRLGEKGAVMKRRFLMSVGVVALSTIAMLAFQSMSKAETAPPMGGGYTDVISIPVNDPAIKAVSGALIKPTGAGPFPAVLYMAVCGGIYGPPNRAMQKATVDHLLSKGIATFIVDSFTPRNELHGICADLGNLAEAKAIQYFTRDSNDALAALKVLQTLPDIDTKHIFLEGYSYGAVGSLMAIDKKNPASLDADVAGVIAYYPFCYDGVDPSVPVLVMVGEKDDWTPAAKCQAVTGKTDFEVVVYPGDTHAFTLNFGKPVDYLGHHMVYDEKATQDAQQRGDAFMTAHMK